MRQSQVGRRATRSVAVLATIVGSAVAGLHAGEVSAGQGADIVLSSETVAPGQEFDALFNCMTGAQIEYSFRGATSTISCGAGGTARAPLTAPDELGQFEVSATVSGVALSAQVIVVPPGQPTLFSGGEFSPNLPVEFSITGCAEGSQVVGEFNGQQTTEMCQEGQNGQTFAILAYLDPGGTGIYPVSATLADPALVLNGAIYIPLETASPGPGPGPGPELPVSGPADSIVMQLVAAAGAVGVGASFIAWARRRRTTISAG